MATLSPSALLKPASGPSQFGSLFRGLIGSFLGFLAALETALAAAHRYEHLSRLNADELKARGFEHGDAARAVFDLYIK